MRRGRLGQKRAPGNTGATPPLWLLSDPRRLPDPSAAARRLPPGSAVLLRDPARHLLRPLAALARACGLRLLVAAQGRTALSLGAGLHLPDRHPAEHLLPFLLSRRHGRGALLSVAAHGRAGLARARRLGADLVILSPVFPTDSHPGAPALGPLRWAALARRAGRPVVALGGLTPRNQRRLPRLRTPSRGGASGWAAIGALL